MIDKINAKKLLEGMEDGEGERKYKQVQYYCNIVDWL
jgi:hypothetical protein